MVLQQLKVLAKDASMQPDVVPTPGAADAKEALESQSTYESYFSAARETDSDPVALPRRSRRKIIIALALAAVAAVSAVFIVKAATNNDPARSARTWTPPTRVRRSWRAYSDAEKEHYLAAVQLAMEKGYHYRFVQIHTEHIGRITAHGSCPFLLWHRRFILGYENMLRSLAPEFANLTLPYWNYFEDTNRQLATDVLCDSLESCSQFLRDMGGGGKTDGRAGENMTIEHVDLEIGTCVSKGIAGHACNHPNGTASGRCANCVMRGQWDNPRKIVQTLGPDLLSVLNVFNATEEDAADEGAHAVLSHEIETTFHNAIHNTLNSTMRYTSSVFDPIFMGHHGMVDLAQLIFNRCKYVSNASLVIDWEKEQRDTRFDVFTTCDVDEQGVYNYTAFGNETMHMMFQGVPVKEDPFMAQFFSGYGSKYADVANAEELDPGNRYTYAIDPYLHQLLESHNVRCPSYLYESTNTKSARRLGEQVPNSQDEDEQDRRVALKLVKTLSACGDSVAGDHPALTYRQRVEQEGLMKCLVVEHKSGGVIEDYDDEFREMMKISAGDAPYCVKLLRRYRQGNLPLLARDECLQEYGRHTGVDLLAKIQRTK